MGRLRVLVLAAAAAGEVAAPSPAADIEVVGTVAEAVRRGRSPDPPELVVVDGRGTGDDARRLARELSAALPGVTVMIAGDAAAGALPEAPGDRFQRDELALLRQAVETMQIGVTLTDLDGHIIYSNPAEAEMHGYQPGDLAGVSARELAPPTRWHQLSSEEKTRIRRWRREVENLRRDGSPFPVRLLSDLVTDAAGEPLGIVTTCEDISDRLRIERELRTSEELLRSVVANTPVVLFALDGDGTFTLSEGKGLAALGLAPGVVVGRSVFELYADNPAVLAACRRALAGETFTATVDAAGHTFEVAYNGVAEVGATRVIGVATDVTGRRDAVRRLEAQERRYRALFEAAPEAVVIARVETGAAPRVLACNARAEEVFGLAAGELVGRPVTDVMAERQSDGTASAALLATLAAELSEGDVRSFDCSCRRADGRSFAAGVTVSLTEIDDDACLQLLIRDITDRVEAESRLRTLLQAVESMDLGLTIADPDGRIVYTNPAEARMHGYERDDLIGVPASVFAAAAWDSGDAGGLDLAHSSSWRRETVNRRRDGSVYPVQLSSVPVTDPHGRVVGLITTSEDITARKVAEDELRRTKEAIERLHTVARTLQRCDDEAEVRSVTLTSARADLGLVRCLIGVLDDGRMTSVETSSGLAGLPGDDLSPVAAVVPLVGAAGSLAVWDELERSPRLAAHWPGFRSMAAATLAGAAVFVAVDPAAGAFPDHQIHLLELLLGHTAEALRRVRLEAELRRQATCDPLTGVRNRRFFSDTVGTEIERSRRAGQPITFLMIDIDRFKEINDRFGHQTGDRVLIDIAELFTRQVRRVDSVVRFGGDEFLVVLVDAEGRADTVVGRIEAELATWNATRSPLDFPVTLSVGQAVWDPAQPVAVNEVLAAADQAMYASKRARESRAAEPTA